METRPEVALATAYSLVWPYLEERQRRLLLAAGARGLGRGGITAIARATGTSRQTVHTALAELDDPGGVVQLATGRTRRPGGGRKPLTVTDPGLLAALDALVDPDTRGDPESPLRWTCKSTAQLARALTAHGHPVSDDTVGRLLTQQGYTLQRTRKTVEGAQHPDRDAQFGYLNQQARSHLADGQPVVSVDTKKRSWSATTQAVAPNGSRAASRSGCWCTTSPTRSWARRSPMGSMTLGPTPAG
jgi:hypothetical protein